MGSIEESEQILSMLKSGKKDAFQVFFDAYYETLLLFSNHLLDDVEGAKDVVQECFVDFWVNRRFDTLNNGLGRYMFHIVKNASLNHIRNRKRLQRKHTAAAVEMIPCVERTIEDEAKEIEILYRAINALPEDRRKIFLLICVDGMKYQEVADHLHISINTVKQQMKRAFQSLRESLKGYRFPALLLLIFKK